MPSAISRRNRVLNRDVYLGRSKWNRGQLHDLSSPHHLEGSFLFRNFKGFFLFSRSQNLVSLCSKWWSLVSSLSRKSQSLTFNSRISKSGIYSGIYSGICSALGFVLLASVYKRQKSVYDRYCLKILRCLSWYIAKANQKRVYPLYMNFLLSLTAHCTRVKVAIRNWTLKLVQCPDLGFSYQRARRRGISGDFTLLQTHSLRIRL